MVLKITGNKLDVTVQGVSKSVVFYFFYTTIGQRLAIIAPDDSYLNNVYIIVVGKNRPHNVKGYPNMCCAVSINYLYLHGNNLSTYYQGTNN